MSGAGPAAGRTSRWSGGRLERGGHGADAGRDRRRPPGAARGDGGAARPPAGPVDGRRRGPGRGGGEAAGGDPPRAPTALAVVLRAIRLGTDSGLRLLSSAPAEARPAIVVLTSDDYPQYA